VDTAHEKEQLSNQLQGTKSAPRSLSKLARVHYYSIRIIMVWAITFMSPWPFIG